MNDTRPDSERQTSPTIFDGNFYSAVFEHHQYLTKSDILTYYAIGDLGDLTHCEAYQDEIAARAGVSLRQCQRSIAKLDEIGLLTVDRTRRQHHIYSYAWPKPTIFSVWRELTPADIITYQAIIALGEYSLQSEITDLTELSKRQILSDHDPGGIIAENLIVWHEAITENLVDLQKVKPPLLWVRICEGRLPSENDKGGYHG